MHCIEPQNEKLIFEGSYFDEGLFTFAKGGKNMSLYNRKISTYINALSECGFKVEKMIEETNSETLNREFEFSSRYYSPSKAKMFPLSVVIKSSKL